MYGVVKHHESKCETAEVGKSLSETKLDRTEPLSTHTVAPTVAFPTEA